MKAFHLLRTIPAALHPPPFDVDAERTTADVAPDIQAKHLGYPLMQHGMDVVDRFEYGHGPVNNLACRHVKVQVSDQVRDGAPFGLLAIKYLNGFPMPFRV